VAGPEKTFDYSVASVRDRWSAGELDMEEALERLQRPAPDDGVLIVRRAA
jgi:hypothetical protein